MANFHCIYFRLAQKPHSIRFIRQFIAEDCRDKLYDHNTIFSKEKHQFLMALKQARFRMNLTSVSVRDRNNRDRLTWIRLGGRNWVGFFMPVRNRFGLV